MKECCGTCKYHKFDDTCFKWVCSIEDRDCFYYKFWTKYSENRKEWKTEDKQKMRFPFTYEGREVQK